MPKRPMQPLAYFGAPLQGIQPEDFMDGSTFFRFGREPKGFDILPAIPGVDFDTAWERRVVAIIDPATGLRVNFVSADDLIASKLASGRPQDLADADAVRKAVSSQIRAPTVSHAHLRLNLDRFD